MVVPRPRRGLSRGWRRRSRRRHWRGDSGAGNLRSTVTGTTVRLDWNGLLEPVVGFLVEAGSASTLANLARLNTGSVSLALVVNNVPNGEYYVRVRAIGPDGIPGPASNEIVVRVGGVPQTLPLAPANFTAQVVNNQVTLSWTAPSSGDPPSSYVVEAGSASSLSNIVVFDTADAATQLTASAPNGRYSFDPRPHGRRRGAPIERVDHRRARRRRWRLRLHRLTGQRTPRIAEWWTLRGVRGHHGSNPASCAWSAVSASSFITLIRVRLRPARALPVSWPVPVQTSPSAPESYASLAGRTSDRT